MRSAEMKEIVLLTRSDHLKKELFDVFQKDIMSEKDVAKVSDSIIFFDLDTMKVGLIRELSPKNYVLALTAQKRTSAIMEATTLGSYEVLQLPLQEETLLSVLQEIEGIRAETRHTVPVPVTSPVPTCAIVGHSPAIMSACKRLARLAQVETPVLITGETGTGKELIAESIAQLSSRFGKPFVVVNCAAVPENLLESELFGFEKGSFTGAIAAKEGMLRIADEGSVFLDEIGELPLSLQGKLLRFLQTQTFYALGGTREIQVNVRVLSATNRDLAAMVKEGKFRDDLYHRLKVTTIHVPSLRERKEDILPLIHFFIGRYKHTAPREIKGITTAFLKKMTSYEWPGNIRELENCIRSALALCKTNYLTTFEVRELSIHPPSNAAPDLHSSFSAAVVPFLREAIRKKERNIYEKIRSEVDKSLFEYVLSYTKENQSEAARILGISRLTLRKKLDTRD
jgi:DNA-binding NtrC family response regulator